MATIKISELRASGSELFQDSESFLNELADREISGLHGGYDFEFALNGSFAFSIGVQTVDGNTVNANSEANLNAAVLF